MKVFARILALSFFLTHLLSFSQTNGEHQHPQEGRVAFVLKNNLGYHRMFRVEGPGIAYGFTMNRNEKTPKNWPVGSRLYFSKDGETRGALILTVTSQDAGTTLYTHQESSPDRGDKAMTATPATTDITVSFRNNSLWFKRITLISYKSDEAANGAYIFTLAPYTASRRRFPAGTRLYIADQKQADLVMSGGHLENAPFLLVRQEHQGQTFDIFNP
jgi:hypothetical protein